MREMGVLLVIVLLVSLVPMSAAKDFEPIFESAACPFDVPVEAVEGEDITCGYVTVPEEHANPNGKTIRLAVAVIRSIGSASQAPLVMAQGGPGGSSLEAFVPVVLREFSTLLRPNRDIIIFDQRGTLYSEPDLVCEEVFEMTADILDENLTAQESNAALVEASRACHERLIGEDINLSAFDSLENAADIPMVVQALGYAEYNFYGVSYGSLLAFHLLRDHPENLRSVIVDAIVPTQVNFIPNTPANGVRSLSLLFETCAADAECSTNFPDLENAYLNLLENLTANPVTVEIRDPETNTPYPAVFNGDALAALTFSSLYAREILPALPKYIYEMTQGNFRWIEIFGGNFLLNRTTADGMNLSVLCAEDSDYTPEEITSDGRYPLFENSLVAFSESYLERCAVWQVEPLDSIVDEPVTSEIPTLILSGEFDPITPPVWGEIAGETLPNSYVYEFPGVGHGSFFGGLCPLNIALAFLENPNEAPEASCIADMQLTFTPPAAAIFETDVFSVEIPLGWENLSSASVASFASAESQAQFDVLAVQAVDVESGILKILQKTKPDGQPIPLDSIETELVGREWTQNVYLNGANAVVVLATQQGDQIIGIVLETTPAGLLTIENALISVWLSVAIP